ncbi:MAG: hypothetical protein ABIY70_12570, partial [Capsulimonas sp.]|uniref:hypothetical protein n=1 Tax=Capsulimonas sp. TaxID=2494211 RepID=UPI0032669A3C
MPDDLSSIQSRISEIQQRIDTLSQNTQPPAPGQQTFAETLHQVQQPAQGGLPVQNGLPVSPGGSTLPASVAAGEIPISLPGLAVHA